MSASNWAIGTWIPTGDAAPSEPQTATTPGQSTPSTVVPDQPIVYEMKDVPPMHQPFLKDEYFMVLERKERFKAAFLSDVLGKIESVAQVTSSVVHSVDGSFLLVIKLADVSAYYVTRLVKEQYATDWVDDVSFKRPSTEDPMIALRLEYLQKTMCLLVEKGVGITPNSSHFKLDVNRNQREYFYVEVPPGGDASPYFRNAQHRPIIMQRNRFAVLSVIGGVDDRSNLPGLERQMATCGPIEYVAPSQRGNCGIYVWYKTAEGFHRAMNMNSQRQNGYQFILTVRMVHEDETDLPPRRACNVGDLSSSSGNSGSSNRRGNGDDSSGVILKEYKGSGCVNGLLSGLSPGSDFEVEVSSQRIHVTENITKLDKRSMFVSQDEPGQWIKIKLLRYVMSPTHMAIRTIPTVVEGPHLRSFAIEALVDGKTEFIRIAEVTEAVTLKRVDFTQVYELEYKNIREIRLVQTGVNWIGTNELSLAGIEFFGSISTPEGLAEAARRNAEARDKKRLANLKCKLEYKNEMLLRQEGERMVIEKEKRERQNKMRRRKMDRLMEMLYLQFCDCFELPLRKALPDMSERDIEATLEFMFRNLPEDMQPHVSMSHK